MIHRITDRERAMALQRLAETDARIANLKNRIHQLKKNGQPTVEAERLLEGLRRSRALMQRQADLLSKDET
jgi:hypothetical protein